MAIRRPASADGKGTVMASALDVRRTDERLRTRVGRLGSRRSSSFSRHGNAENTHCGLPLVSNDDVVAPGTGFDAHLYRDMEIIT